MPSTPKAIEVFKASGGAYFPAKAANAGGVAVSGLEMAQNSVRYFWTREEVDQKLQRIMSDIWKQSSETAKVKPFRYSCKPENSILKSAQALGHPGDYQLGANAAGFKIVADAMLAQGQA